MRVAGSHQGHPAGNRKAIPGVIRSARFYKLRLSSQCAYAESSQKDHANRAWLAAMQMARSLLEIIA